MILLYLISCFFNGFRNLFLYSIIYHVIGEEKAQIVFDLLYDSPPPDFPVTHIAGEWYLDRLSASKLS